MLALPLPTMTKRTHHRSADQALSVRVMQLEPGKRLTSMFEVPPEFPSELRSLLLRMAQADQTAERSQ
jgi:hypothetical protein